MAFSPGGPILDEVCSAIMTERLTSRPFNYYYWDLPRVVSLDKKLYSSLTCLSLLYATRKSS